MAPSFALTTGRPGTASPRVTSTRNVPARFGESARRSAFAPRLLVGGCGSQLLAARHRIRTSALLPIQQRRPRVLLLSTSSTVVPSMRRCRFPGMRSGRRVIGVVGRGCPETFVRETRIPVAPDVPQPGDAVCNACRVRGNVTPSGVRVTFGSGAVLRVSDRPQRRDAG